MEQWLKKQVDMKTVLSGLVIVAAVGFVAGAYGGTRQAGALTLNGNMPEGVDFSPVWQTWATINDKFVPAAVSTTTPLATTTAELNKQKVYGMAEGLASSLHDPYTVFLPPQENEDFNSTMAGEFEGVGMEIDVKEGVLTVVSPLKGTPAEAAGMKAKDLIVKIDGEDTTGMDTGTAVHKIRGPRGTQVTFTVVREGWDKPKEIKVTRDVINLPIVTTTNRDDGVFVIAVSTFTSSSPELFRKALREFAESGKNRLVIDLRGNPGGYLEAAVSMASWFLPSGYVIVSEDYANKQPTITHRSYGYNAFNDQLRMVVLVNGGSASASEILAAALQQRGGAKLIGTKTFGKGTVQELVDIGDAALKLTVARWLTPNGEPIPRTGIVPDITVERTDKDIEEKLDPQMDKAVEIVRSM